MIFGHPKDCEPCSLEEALDRLPCKFCNRHYDNHFTLCQEEIDRAKEQGCIVELCEKRTRWTFEGEGVAYKEDEAWFCVVITPPENPMTEEDMLEIST